ncbi:MAG: phosphoribosylanthranilate isomerase [Desulfohalobiaceae bacterium]|nr:phosphoribosylanthranilate isomerase [Desulfohalobiaceae bacterium]
MLLKICGLTRQEDVLLCQALGVDLLGFIFHEASPRFVNPEAVAGFVRAEALRVGVFVGQSVARILHIKDLASLDLIQLHGDYSPVQCRAIGPDRVIKVFWPQRYPGPDEFFQDLRRYAACCRYFLLDAGQAGGGHGQTLQTEWINKGTFARPWFLAGGLCSKNVHNFVQQYKPDGLDMNSGVEKRPGIKDRQKLIQSRNVIKRRQA